MFVRCKILLSQNNDTTEMTLERMTGGALSEGYSQWGACSSSENNIKKVWIHALAAWEVRIMEVSGPGVGMVGGGLKFGEMAALPPCAILSRAITTERGIEPFDSSGVGTGKVVRAAEVSVRFHPGPMTWRLSSFQLVGGGSSQWQRP